MNDQWLIDFHDRLIKSAEVNEARAKAFGNPLYLERAAVLRASAKVFLDKFNSIP